MASTPDPHVLAFGTAVRRRREELGLSQEALGFRAKIHRTYVSDVERGARNPTVKVIWKLADALETEPSRLFSVAEAGLPRGQQPRRS
jgi:transcriptional regulator with XRE-family HTH domain